MSFFFSVMENELVTSSLEGWLHKCAENKRKILRNVAFRGREQMIDTLNGGLIAFSDQHILIGTDEGIYTFNLNEIHENTMELVRHITTCVVHLLPHCFRPHGFGSPTSLWVTSPKKSRTRFLRISFSSISSEQLQFFRNDFPLPRCGRCQVSWLPSLPRAAWAMINDLVETALLWHASSLYEWPKSSWLPLLLWSQISCFVCFSAVFLSLAAKNFLRDFTETLPGCWAVAVPLPEQ